MLSSCRSSPSIVISGLFTIAMFACVLISIRSSFLVDSFGSRGVDGKIYCAVESSLGIGFLLSFFLRLVERLTYSYKVQLKVIMLTAYACSAVLGVATGLIFLLANNTVVVSLSFLVRSLQGIAHHTYCHCLVESLKCWFPKHFKTLIGMVLNTGLFVGYGIGQLLGAVLYQKYGYLAPYLIVPGLILLNIIYNCVVLPSEDVPLVTDEDYESDTESGVSESDSGISSTDSSDEMQPILKPHTEQPISWCILLPLASAMCVNCIYGYVSVAIVPYLRSAQGISISAGGYYLLVLSLSVAIGSFCAGVISATLRPYLSILTQMTLGSVTLLLGTLLLFPPSTVLQQNYYLPFFAVLIAGIGDPLVTVATVPAMEEMQRGRLSSKQCTMVSSAWLIGWVTSINGGTVLAGLVIDYWNFEIGAYILLTCCIVSLVINVCIKCVKRRHSY